jgi:hypothetical protein
MTVIVRRFVSVPARSAAETWKAISDLLASAEKSEGARELASVTGAASSLIAREAMTSPIVVHGSGPRVRIYCLYDDDAIEGDDVNETALPFDVTSGDWKLSLPCPAEDLGWVQNTLKAKSTRITARDMAEPVEKAGEQGTGQVSGAVDMEAFFKS